MYRSQMKMGGGAAWFDLDRDGDEDVILSGGLDGEGLFRNDGNGLFTEITYAAGLGFLDSVQTMGVVTGDIDNDGYREIFFTTAPGEPNHLLYNNGNATFSDITQSAGLIADTSFSTSAMFLDLDHDKDLDLFVGNYVLSQTVLYDTSGTPIGFQPECLPDYVYLNNGNLSFTESSAALGFGDSACALAVTQTNLHPYTYLNTVMVANDFGMWHVPNQSWVEQSPGGQYAEEANAMDLDVGMYGMGFAQVDYDHDLDMDYYITDIGPNKLMRRISTFPPLFQDAATAAGVQNGLLSGLATTGWGTAFLDIDNDSWEDLYACNGHITTLPFIANVLRDPDKLWHNNGNGTFTDITVAAGVIDSGLGRGMIRGDYDLDGDDDILTMVIHWDTLSGEHTKLWRNDLNNANHWVNIRLEGGVISPRDPFGAIVEIHTPSGNWMQEISGGGSHMSQHSSIVHVGLGQDTTYSVFIHWPNGGIQYHDTLPIDSTITVMEDMDFWLGNGPAATRLGSIVPYPNPSSGAVAAAIDVPMEVEGRLEVWDVQGRRISQSELITFPAGQSIFPLPSQNLAGGIYVLRLTGAGLDLHCRLVRN